ncbi:MAG TPA: hypothetical protein VF988_08545 [Verrucomicrobiae bacterium]
MLLLGWLAPGRAADGFPASPTNATPRVVVAQGRDLLTAFSPNEARVEDTFNQGLKFFTHEPAVNLAWRSLVATNDVVGIKVFVAPGPICGTRPAVVSAIVRGLLDAGLPPRHIVIWDKHAADLRAAGYFELGDRLGVRVAGAVECGYDTNAFYLPDSPVVGQLVWGDLEFGRTNKDFIIGKKSFVSRLVSQQMTKIISVAPLMNENSAGLCGHFYSLGLGGLDNTRRFESDPDRLAVALPEILALPQIGDRVALYVTDALLAQHQGGPGGYLQFSQVRNEIWFSHDPVALDTTALRELTLQRRLLNAPMMPANLGIYTNAVLLQLGVSNPARVHIEKVTAD